MHKVNKVAYTYNMKKKIIWIFSPLLIGIITSLIFKSTTYKVIIKPPLSPPGIVFPIVWSILYLLMGISFYLVSKDNYNKKTTKLFILQLIVNYLWPLLFFKLKLYVFSALWIILLIYLVFKMIKDFLQHNKTAGYLQIPYFVWLLFALYLNIGVAFLN